MRRLIIALAILHLGLTSASAEESPAVAVVESFYGALKAGDVETLRALIGEPLYSEYQVLLTQNSEYPNFLRTHYEGSSGAVVAATDGVAGKATVDFDVTFQNGSHSALRLYLQVQEDATWKIVEQEVTN